MPLFYIIIGQKSMKFEGKMNRIILKHSKENWTALYKSVEINLEDKKMMMSKVEKKFTKL